MIEAFAKGLIVKSLVLRFPSRVMLHLVKILTALKLAGFWHVSKIGVSDIPIFVCLKDKMMS